MEQLRQVRNVRMILAERTISADGVEDAGSHEGSSGEELHLEGNSQGVLRS
jgi:hypothetical protein